VTSSLEGLYHRREKLYGVARQGQRCVGIHHVVDADDRRVARHRISAQPVAELSAAHLRQLWTNDHDLGRSLEREA
jgi:hypothetical protein